MCGTRQRESSNPDVPRKSGLRRRVARRSALKQIRYGTKSERQQMQYVFCRERFQPRKSGFFSPIFLSKQQENRAAGGNSAPGYLKQLDRLLTQTMYPSDMLASNARPYSQNRLPHQCAHWFAMTGPRVLCKNAGRETRPLRVLCSPITFVGAAHLRAAQSSAIAAVRTSPASPDCVAG